MGPDASRTRKALVSLVGTLVYNFLQVGFPSSHCTFLTLVEPPGCRCHSTPRRCFNDQEPTGSNDRSNPCLRTATGCLELPLVGAARIVVWVDMLELLSHTDSVSRHYFIMDHLFPSGSRDNTPREDTESATQPGESQPATRPGDSRHRRQQDRGTPTATNSEDPPVPYNHIYARLVTLSFIARATHLVLGCLSFCPCSP